MTDVVVVCEGRTEEAFVKEVVQPTLATKDVYMRPRLISTSSEAKGGALSGDRVIRYLSRTLNERGDTYVTTLFDLYGLPVGFPGQSSPGQRDPITRCGEIEDALHRLVVKEAGCRGDRFVPHIQPYEYEALLFSDTTAFGQVESEWKPYQMQLAAIASTANSPEHINDSLATHPSARLKDLLPGYGKVAHGVALAARIGIERMRAECRHFGQWLGRMETLQPLRSQT